MPKNNVDSMKKGSERFLTTPEAVSRLETDNLRGENGAGMCRFSFEGI
jgi:hypothetical protein